MTVFGSIASEACRSGTLLVLVAPSPHFHAGYGRSGGGRKNKVEEHTSPFPPFGDGGASAPRHVT